MKCKKFIAAAIAVVLAASLCACSGGSSSSGSAASEVSAASSSDSSAAQSSAASQSAVTEANVGDILDAPEKTVEGTQLYASYSVTDSSTESSSTESSRKTYEIAVKDDTASNTGVLYITDGVSGMHNNEIIMYIKADGSIDRYTRNVLEESFTKDTTSTSEELAQYKSEAENMLIYTGYGGAFATQFPNAKLKKCEDQENVLTGECYVYDIIENDTSTGQLWVDKETGIWVKITNASGTTMEASQISLTEVDIPDYN